MPISKKRKKNGKKVGGGVAARRAARDAELAEIQRDSGVSLQDLINTVAYQEYVAEGKIEAPENPVQVIDFSDPDTQAVIKAVDSIDIDNKEQD